MGERVGGIITSVIIGFFIAFGIVSGMTGYSKSLKLENRVERLELQLEGQQATIEALVAENEELILELEATDELLYGVVWMSAESRAVLLGLCPQCFEKLEDSSEFDSELHF